MGMQAMLRTLTWAGAIGMALVVGLLPGSIPSARAQSRDAAPSSDRAAPKQARKSVRKPVAVAPPPAAKKQLTRPEFTADEQRQAEIPGLPGVRFWGDSADDYARAVPAGGGAWLILSSGGEDGAYGAGVLSGWSQSGKRPDFPVVTGISTGALMAVFAFAGPKYDDVLRKAYTGITSADIFELSPTPESLVDTWPLKRLIEKNVTTDVLVDVAAEYKRGRRLFVLTTNLDAGRSVVWDMGMIAARGGEDAVRLFRDVLLASSAIPGPFPPVYIEVEANGRRFLELHVDGGVNGPMYIAPESYLFPGADKRLPMSQLYILLNGKVRPEFYMPARTTSTVLGRSISLALQMGARMDLVLFYGAAQRDGVDFNLAYVDSDFNVPARGAFDADYMKALFDRGYEQGRKAEFAKSLPFRKATAVSEGSGGAAPQSK
jgi:predicted acylesterase/phospholipase RssA